MSDMSIDGILEKMNAYSGGKWSLVSSTLLCIRQDGGFEEHALDAEDKEEIARELWHFYLDL